MAIIGNIPYFQTNPYHPLSPKKKTANFAPPPPRRTASAPHLWQSGSDRARPRFFVPMGLEFDHRKNADFCWDFLGFTGMSWDSLEFIGIYWDSLGFIGISWDSIGWFSREHLHRSTSGTTRGEGVISPPKKLEYDLQNCGRPLKSAAPM